MQRRLRIGALAAAALMAGGAVTAAAAITYRHAGPQGNGTSVTPNGWNVTPAGRQVDLADATWWPTARSVRYLYT